MAADTEPINEWVEGYNESGKLLDRITKVPELQEQQKKMKREEVELNKQLQKEQQDMGELQHKLKETNDKYAEEKQKLDELRSEQRVTLDGDQKTRIMTVTRETVDSFVCRIPRSKEEQMTVDVHFLTGTETTGFNLQLNGEGAGSRDAKFLVKLNQKVQSLAEQAAKYWGLDANKVFFLDRDGRIVLDSMNLKDIILPPAPSSASTEASTGAGGDQLAQDKDLWMVRGRNYCLTLVRASTVLSKEDLNRPKGEKWEDFTFNNTELEKELERTRKKRAGEEGEAQKINMDAIPSLHELMQQGQEKKRKKRVETRCRCFELLVFIFCEVCFLGAIRNLSDYSGLPLINQQTERFFTNFTAADNSSAFGSGHVASFQTIHTNEQYFQWVNGPVKRTLETLMTDRAGTQQVTLLGALATLYEASAYDHDSDADIRYCTPEPIPPNTTTATSVTMTSTTSTFTADLPSTTTSTLTATVTSSTFTVTMTSTSSSRTSSSTSFTSTITSTSTYIGTSVTSVTSTSSTATRITLTSTSSTTSFIPVVLNDTNVPSYGSFCVPREFEPCLNQRAMKILGKGFFLDHEVPRCKPRFTDDPSTVVNSVMNVGEPFAFSYGKVSTYYGGKIFPQFSNDVSATLSNFLIFRPGHAVGYPNSERGMPHHREFVGSAHSYSIALYLPTINNIFIYEFIVENPLSGSLLTTVQRHMVQMDNELPLPTILMSISMVLAVVVLFLDVRRIFGCPRACTFEEERSYCSVWTLFMIMLVFFIPTIILLHNISRGMATDTIKGLATDGVTDETVSQLWVILKMRQNEMNMKTITTFIFSVLQVKFLLMNFPQLGHLTYVVRKSLQPLLAIFLILTVVFFSFCMMLTSLYGEHVQAFSSIGRTWLSAVIWSMGNVRNWQELYSLSPEIFPVLLFLGFLVVQVTLNFLPAVVMISHKKDADLIENYSYHTHWAIERTRNHASKDPHSTNPALIGHDFSGKEPKPVERQEGWLAAAAIMTSSSGGG